MFKFNVSSKEEAQAAIATLLLNFSGEVAFTELYCRSRGAKQAVSESSSRMAGNLLTSGVVYKPGGYV